MVKVIEQGIIKFVFSVGFPVDLKARNIYVSCVTNSWNFFILQTTIILK